MKKNKTPYYLGLDCGTNSVGWAATDEKYVLRRAKGKDLWGVRLFEEAQSATDRHTHRSARRRLAREKSRLKLLELLFSEEMAKVDPNFYLRLKNSFLVLEDKSPTLTSKNTLFDDKGYTDQDFHRDFPTIWHLRKHIIENSRSEKRQSLDLRFYFLAIHHILKHRGHFLIDGDLQGAGNFSDLFQELQDALAKNNFSIDEASETDFEEKLTTKTSKQDKKKVLAAFFSSSENAADPKPFAALLAGSDNVNLASTFGLDEDLKITFSKDDFEESLLEIEKVLLPEQIELIKILKKIYDYQILKKLLRGHSSDTISYAMVDNYSLHQTQLKALKIFFKSNKEIYRKLFQTSKFDPNFPSYTAYIGKAYTEKAGRKSSVHLSQDDFCAHLAKLLETANYQPSPKSSDFNLLALAKNGELLPKQRGQAKGTIPMQLHANELKIIVSELTKDFPSFNKPIASEPAEYNTKCKKLLKIHSFRIPYYVGPLVPKSKSQFSWADEEIAELIRPWNFSEIFTLSRRGQLAEKFIRRMTNSCTYLLGEDVLPKSSLDYQKFMVLNELNNLRLNGRPLDISLKQTIYNKLFRSGDLKGSITLNILKNSLLAHSLIYPEDELSGTNDQKFLPTLSTHLQLMNILGHDYEKKFPHTILEQIIESATALNEEKSILAERISILLPNIKEDAAKTLSKRLRAKDWGNFSLKFLTGIFADISGRKMSILDALYETQDNLMTLLGSKYTFKNIIENHNLQNQGQTPRKLTYEKDIKNLYCSPAVKRTIWQSLKIIRELTSVLGSAPAKIFIESTRGASAQESARLRTKSAKSRYARFLEIYKNLTQNPEAKEILEELKNYDKVPSDLLKKKLYLYFSQMGHCAYSGERIDLDNLSAYDIDHIYPRSLTKDDSLERNLVLVKSELNRSKTNNFLCETPYQTKELQFRWHAWRKAGLITNEKYLRLTRKTPLAPEELGSFIARQLIETSQSVKVLRDVLAFEFPNTKIVLVRGNQVSALRREFGDDKKDQSDNLISKGHYEFIKIRNLNDLHHAKDAYLNIVVGNVLNTTFTDDPRSWVAKREGKNYSLRTSLLFRPSKEWRRKDGTVISWPEMQAWDYQNSFNIMSKTMSKNSILITRMTHEQTGELFDLQIVAKSPENSELIPIKSGLDIKKYGGFNKAKGAYFALIETRQKDRPERRIVQIPIIAKSNPETYLQKTYPNSRIILHKILFKSLFIINGFPLYLAGKTNDALSFWPAFQLKYVGPLAPYLKTLLSGKSLGSQLSLNKQLFDLLSAKLNHFLSMPMLGSKIPEIQAAKTAFANLCPTDQAAFLIELLKITSANATTGDLSKIVTKASQIGKCFSSSNLRNYTDISLVQTSPTGVFEKRIDLKTYEPGD